ncbi:MAG: helix-turn-helix transcriptional regulator [Lachnospiraceae bacterium]|nr:helix-turn-helix transcriptional regulator [Lachnospiraceae bacterium]
MIDRKIKEADLKASAKISPGTYAKLNRDKFVSMDVIAKTCTVRNCKVEDIFGTGSDRI